MPSTRSSPRSTISWQREPSRKRSAPSTQFVRTLSGLTLKLLGSSPGRLLIFIRILPRPLLSGLRRAAFRRTLRLAASRSAFYRRAFARHGIDIKRVRSPEDLGEFFLSSADLKGTPPADFFCAEPELAIESSGTTGQVTRIFLSQRELDYNARQAAVLSAVYGLTAADRVVSTLDLGFGLGGLLALKGFPYWRSFGMAVGRVAPEEVYERMAFYGFNVVISDPFWLSRLTEVARERGRPVPLKLLIGGGEGITARTRSEIEEFWEAPLYMTYSSTETATLLGFECLEQDGYHLNEFDFFVEVPEPDADGYGEIVFTTTGRTVMPLIRYRTGDVAKLVDGPCRCGFPFRRLSLLRGRTDELVACAWGNVHPELFEDLLAGIPGLGPEWQVGLVERGLRPTFQFRLECLDGSVERAEVIHRILGALQRQQPTSWQAYCQRLVDLEFLFLLRGTLRTDHKLLRLVDERWQPEPSRWASEVGTVLPR
ncbi:MAG: phenylacetate--CoA ligase family protein [Candidatus Methylomirabilia bacterium]